MSSNEPARHALYARLEDVLGSEHADTLMTCLPRGDADEVATRTDVGRLEDGFGRLEDRFGRLEDRFDRLEDIVREQQKFYVGTVVASMTALTTAFSVVVVLLG